MKFQVEDGINFYEQELREQGIDPVGNFQLEPVPELIGDCVHDMAEMERYRVLMELHILALIHQAKGLIHSKLPVSKHSGNTHPQLEKLEKISTAIIDKNRAYLEAMFDWEE